MDPGHRNKAHLTSYAGGEVGKVVVVGLVVSAVMEERIRWSIVL